MISAMFSANVFRHLPLLSYAPEDEIDTETMWEFKQLKPVYEAFAAFLGLDGFDEEKLVPYANGTFVEALTRRLDSCVEAERDCVKRILFLLFERATSLRAHLCRSTVNSLLNYGRLQSIGGGVGELLEVFNVLVRHKLVETPIIAEVFVLQFLNNNKRTFIPDRGGSSPKKRGGEYFINVNKGA